MLAKFNNTLYSISTGIIFFVSTLQLASRTLELSPSPTLSISSKAKFLKDSGVDVISLGAGEPDFNTPQEVCEAAHKAMQDGLTKYTPTRGIPALREAICQKLLKQNNLHYTSDDIVVTSGAKHALYNSMMTLLEPGDEIVLIVPYWMTYAEQAKLAGAMPVFVQTTHENNFLPTIDQLKEVCTNKTKAILINSPTNPTGATWPRQLLKEVAAFALKNGLWIISDEIYEQIIYGEQHTSIASLGKEIKEQTITIGGVSKAYAMTGWRIGFAAAPKPVATKMTCLQDQVTSCPNAIAQVASITAFGLPDSYLEQNRKIFEKRKELITNKLREIPNIHVPDPTGAFYIFPYIKNLLNEKISNDLILAEKILDEAKVATIPGSVFKGENYIRLSYAASEENIIKAVDRIKDFVMKSL